MSTLLAIICEFILIGIVITFLPQILCFIAVCFALACIFSLVTGLAKGSE